MPSTGPITLGQVAKRAASLGISCSRCERAERFNLGVLIARHGRNFDIPRLLELLSTDCPTQASRSARNLCGIHAPELPRLFLGANHR